LFSSSEPAGLLLMDKRFFEVRNGGIVGGPYQRPSFWRGTTIGGSATDDTFRHLGLWPIEADDSGAAQWEQESNRTRTVDTEREVVVETVHYELVPLDQRKDTMRGQAREQFQATLASGFDDGSGTVWAATDDARTKILDRTQRIQEFRAGKFASPLPNGKSTVKLWDASNTPHDADVDKILSLAEQGDDFQDRSEDWLEELLASIDAATSHSDLDQIKLNEGWPS